MPVSLKESAVSQLYLPPCLFAEAWPEATPLCVVVPQETVGAERCEIRNTLFCDSVMSSGRGRHSCNKAKKRFMYILYVCMHILYILGDVYMIVLSCRKRKKQQQCRPRL